ncbi:MAG: S1 family peptidase [Candidatus Dormibacteraeota bacterium]|nr:S1 family peptidase [Candidatus Dormibacteraeota bacterium]
MGGSTMTHSTSSLGRYQLRLAIVLAAALTIMTPMLGVATRVGRFDVAAATPDRPDVEQYAAIEKVSVTEAARRMRIEELAGDLEPTVAAAMPSSFGGLFIEHSPAFRVVVLSTRPDDHGLVDRLALAGGLQGETDFRVVPFAWQDLLADAKGIRQAHRGEIDVNVNVFTNTIDVMAVAPSDPLRASLPSTARIRSVAALASPTTLIFGGLPISLCTSGFTVKKFGSTTKGIVTAGHCGNSQSYAGNSLPFQAESFGGSNDEQWHTVPGLTTLNLVRISPSGTTRDITTRTYAAGQATGTLVCKYGTTTGYGCGYLTSKTFAPGYVPNANGTFHILAKNGVDLSNRGDSGGPVFLGNSAWGIISGEVLDFDNHCICDLIYAATDYVEGGLGVLIVTS